MVPQGTWHGISTILQLYQGTTKVNTITARDDSKGKFVGISNIKNDSSPLIENVVLIEGLKNNLLSINQLCDKGLKVIFDNFTCDILDKKINTCVLSGF